MFIVGAHKAGSHLSLLISLQTSQVHSSSFLAHVLAALQTASPAEELFIVGSGVRLVHQWLRKTHILLVGVLVFDAIWTLICVLGLFDACYFHHFLKIIDASLVFQ